MVFDGILEFMLADLKEFWVIITFPVKAQEWLVKWREG